MTGIIRHLTNYNQPREQIYIVRILWMVPLYSIESWLAMRFHDRAIYIETLRDFYESYVLYSFLQYLIEVLGGEESLVLMLKDKSPTRGFHMWGVQWCIKPWLMGQPVSKTVYERSGRKGRRAIKRVHWKSPFFVKCKFGVLQYVLLKFLSAIAVLGLEWRGVYHEGSFSWQSGYLYVCIITNLSQCWALYCMIFFYFACKNELSPIRPVGKFLSVKALVFFTWWQSVLISMLYDFHMLPKFLVNIEKNWTEEDVAKGIQDYLICVEMFIAAVVHSFVFPHTEYSPQAVEARALALNPHGRQNSSSSNKQWGKKRLGRSKYHPAPYAPYWTSLKDDASKSSNLHAGSVVEMTSLGSESTMEGAWEDPSLWQPVQPQTEGYSSSQHSRRPRKNSTERFDRQYQDFTDDDVEQQHQKSQITPKANDLVHGLSTVDDDEDDHQDEDNIMTGGAEKAPTHDNLLTGRLPSMYDDSTSYNDDEDDTEVTLDEGKPKVAERQGFVRALFESVIPRDLGENTIGIVKGDYNVEKKTLLHHAATSDQYDLFSPNRRRLKQKNIGGASKK